MKFLQTCKNKNGFALTELIVVIALIGIVLSIAVLNFKEWQDKANIEKTTRELQSDISQLRQKSMTRKIEHNITLNANSYVFRQFSSAGDIAGTVIKTSTISYNLTDTAGIPLSALVISFNDRGFTTNNNTIVVGPITSSASVNCMRIHTARTNLGKMNGSTCEFN